MIKFKFRRYGLFAFSFLISICFAQAAPSETMAAKTSPSTAQRPYAIDDLLRLENLGQARFSPDGQFLALERIKPYDQAKEYGTLLDAGGRNRSEVWIVDAKANKSVEVVVLGADSIWAGPWAPDSHKLFVYSYAVSDSTISVGIWDLDKKRYKKLPGKINYTNTNVVWISDHDVIYPIIPPGRQQNTIAFTKDNWLRLNKYRQKSWQGKEPSYTIMESGPRLLAGADETGKLLRVNIGGNTVEVLALGRFDTLLLSPSRDYLMAIKTGAALTPSAERSLMHVSGMIDSFLRTPMFFDLKNRQTETEISEDLDILPSSFTWSPGSKKFAFIARPLDQSWLSANIYVYEVNTGALRILKTSTINMLKMHDTGGTMPPLYWLNGNPVLLREKRHADKTTAFPVLWSLSDNRPPVRISQDIPQPITQLFQLKNDLLAIAGDKLWHISESGTAIKIGATEKGVSITGFSAQASFSKETKLIPIIVTGNQNAYQAYVDMEKNEFTITDILAQEASLATYAPSTSSFVYRRINDTGKYFTLVSGQGLKQKELFHVNKWLGGIKYNKLRSIRYSLPEHNQTGDEENKLPLTGMYLTPPDYVEGKRYPVISFVYGGSRSSGWADPQSSFYLSPQILAAQGYVVLFPYLPIDRTARPLDIPGQFAAAINAAIDKLVEEGVADPDRLAIMGQSYGAYTTLSILTQTDRFKAAIATNGFYNLSSLYASIAPGMRLDSLGHINSEMARWAETGQGRLSVAPWQDPEKYVRNSPFFFANKITTPVLFIHGDQDLWPITQTEEMFNALYRQRKDARFIRFWGEGHAITSPANIRQAWKEVSRWLADYLK